MKEEMKDLFKESFIEAAPEVFTDQLLLKLDEKEAYKPLLPSYVWIIGISLFVVAMVAASFEYSSSFDFNIMQFLSPILEYLNFVYFFFSLGLAKFLFSFYTLRSLK